MNPYQFYEWLKASGFRWIFLLANSVGEAFIISSLLKAFRDENDGKVLLVIPVQHEVIPRVFYPTRADHVISLAPSFIRAVSRIAVDAQPKLTPYLPYSLVLSDSTGGYAFSLVERFLGTGKEGLKLDSLYKLCLGLSFDAIPEIPTIAKCFGVIPPTLGDELKTKDNRVLFFPKNNTQAGLDRNFWVRLAGKLKEQNIVVDVCQRGGVIGPDLSGELNFNFVNFDLCDAIKLGSSYRSIFIGSNGLSFLMASMFEAQNASLNVIMTRLKCVGADHRDIRSYKKYESTEGLSMRTYPDYTGAHGCKLKEWDLGEGIFGPQVGDSFLEAMSII